MVITKTKKSLRWNISGNRAARAMEWPLQVKKNMSYFWQLISFRIAVVILFRSVYPV